jgi:hypothetical protein
MEIAKGMQRKDDLLASEEMATSKLLDLLSRINGGTISIPSLELVEEDRDRRVDKICIAIGLLLARFGTQLTDIPRSLLHFIATTQFRYGVRSIAHLVSLIPHLSKPKTIPRSKLKLPLTRVGDLRKSSLAYHLIDDDQAHGIVDKWVSATRNDTMLMIGIKAIQDAIKSERTTQRTKTKRLSSSKGKAR